MIIHIIQLLLCLGFCFVLDLKIGILTNDGLIFICLWFCYGLANYKEGYDE